MLDPETKRKIRELGLPAMIEAVEMTEADSLYAGLTFDERMKIIVDHTYQSVTTAKIERLKKNAHFRLPQADISDIDYDGRPLKRELILELGTAQFVSTATSIILEGFTGTGKSHLACALGKQACKKGMRVLYIRMPDLFDYWSEKKSAGWSEKRILKRLLGYKVLIIDEFLLEEIKSEDAHFLMELMERRFDCTSTIFCTQYPLEDWRRRLGDDPRAESILDRIVHNKVRIVMGEVNMRERLAAKEKA